MTARRGQEGDCTFCGIVADPSDSHVVWDERDVIAFMDIDPATSGHLLVVPKEHSDALTDMPAVTAGRLMQVAQHVARAMMASDLQCEGINLFLAEGEVAFQEVFHAHLHVMPRYQDDGFTINARWQGPSDHGLAETAAAIRAGLDLAQD